MIFLKNESKKLCFTPKILLLSYFLISCQNSQTGRYPLGITALQI